MKITQARGITIDEIVKEIVPKKGLYLIIYPNSDHKQARLDETINRFCPELRRNHLEMILSEFIVVPCEDDEEEPITDWLLEYETHLGYPYVRLMKNGEPIYENT